jgi:hypothetical protein
LTIFCNRTSCVLSEADPDAAEVFAGDLYLDRIIQTQRTIQSYDEIIKEIDALLASGDYPQHTERLVRERQWAMERKAESEVLYQKYMADLIMRKQPIKPLCWKFWENTTLL